MDYVNVTNQKELDEFLNDTTIDKSDYCIDIRANEPLVVKSSEVDKFKIYGDSVVRFLEVPFETCIYAYGNAVAVMELKNDSRVFGFGYDNSIIVNWNKCNNLDCALSGNATLKDRGLDPNKPQEIGLRIYDISTQERLDECVKLYGNYSNAKFCINQSYSEHGSELVVNQKINGVFELRDESRVVFKKPTNSDNESIDYYIFAFGKSTAILETNKCKIRSYHDATIIKRCKGEFVYECYSDTVKFIDESHLLDTNKHKETSKGWGK
ncbi:MAG: hypothetical protein LBF68_07285 [Christensenellaceae bacterium]|jgi:hypothetical protein|nr:hypothetical protein [Christensenellaceae bacterium]